MQENQPAGVTPAAAPAGPGSVMRIAWAAFAVLLVGIIVAAFIRHSGPGDKWPVPGIYGEVPAFELPRENGTTVTLADYAGKVSVWDFVFTRCGGQCPYMSLRMQELQTWLSAQGLDEVKLVSATVDPEYDTPEVFAEYAKKYDADPARWAFLSGPRSFLHPFIQVGFQLGIEEDSPDATEEEWIVHSSRFVLVDGKGQIRGYYDCYDLDELERLRADIRSVVAE